MRGMKMVEQISLKQTHPYPLWMFSPRSERVLYPHSPEQTNYCIDIIQIELLYFHNHNKTHGRMVVLLDRKNFYKNLFV